MKRLVMWDIDRTLLIGGGVAVAAWKTAFTAVTGLPWQKMAVTGGRTDRDISAEVFAVHGIDDCEPHLDAFFAAYADEVHATRHRFAEQGHVLPGVREVLAGLAQHPHVVQTLVTGNIPAVAAAKVAAFDLTWAFDADVGGYGTDDSVRATLVRRSRERAEAKYGHGFEAVVIGDTVHDVTAALANDARVIAVATGQTPIHDLVAAGAHHVLPDMSDVDAVVTLIAG
jgi:phosphoglycolate phosphatase